MSVRFQWEWGYYGRCFVNEKLSHTVGILKVGEGYDVSVWAADDRTDKNPYPMSGMMLSAGPRCKTLDEAIELAEKTELKILETMAPNLKSAHRKLEVYPFERPGSRNGSDKK